MTTFRRINPIACMLSSLLAGGTMALFASTAIAENGVPFEHSQQAELSIIDNGNVRVGIDANKGGSISWISSRSYPKNIVNHADPGRLIQQSFYAGKGLDRKQDGQIAAWSPWAWNPIQGGGVGAWALATRIEKTDDNSLYSEATPKLWDMPDEDAQALMRQWVSFELDMKNTVVVRCQFESLREENDRWGSVGPRHQEVPACYFVRSFSNVTSYQGDGQWQGLEVRLGPPWGKISPKHKALAMFNEDGEGIAIFSPTANSHWNVGPHSTGDSDDPKAKPCMHVAPLSNVRLPSRSTYEYRYWLVVGDRTTIESDLDELLKKYSGEQAKLTE